MGHFEQTLAAAATVEAIAVRQDGFDAFVVACYGDPGLYAARELVEVPVVGIAEASLLLACTLALQFSVVTVIPRIVPMLRDLVRRYGLESRCASVCSSGLSVLDIRVDQEQAGEAIRGGGDRPWGRRNGRGADARRSRPRISQT